MTAQYYIACYKKNKQDTIGYLFLQSKGRKNRAKKALGIPIKYEFFLKYFNEKEQKFKSGLENYKLINEKIENELNKLAKDEVKLESKKGKHSFLKYWEKELSLETNQGSLSKYTVVKTKLEKYIASTGKNDISFNDLTPDFFKDLQFYFKTAKDPKPLSPNSVTQYLKIIGVFINRKLENDPYLFKIHPLTGVKFDPKKPVERKVLDDNELVRLHSTKLDDVQLDYFRDMFLFQLFANGMRVSDLLLLRWNTINPDINNWEYKDGEIIVKVKSGDKDPEPEIKYKMFKTDKVMTVPFSFYMCKALLRTTGDYEMFMQYLDKNIIVEYQDTFYRYEKDILPEFKKNTFNEYEPNTINYRGYFIKNEKNDYIKGLIDAYIKGKETLISCLPSEAANSVLRYVITNNCENQFVFPILNNEDFKGVSENEVAFKEQVATDRELKRALLNGEKKYREKLKKIADQCRIKKMPSHSARHTFAKLLDLEGAPTHDIKDKLGHTTLDTTSNYMQHTNFKDKKQSNIFTQKLGNKTDYLDN